jgi:hypothetical protein
VCGAGLAWARRQLAKVHEPVLVCGFDEEPHVRQRVEGTLLNARGVAYIRLPVAIGELRKVVGSLVRDKEVSLDADSIRKNIIDFQAELRSDFWHGPLLSIRRNMNGILSNLRIKQYSEAQKTLKINLNRYSSAMLSLKRIRDKFPLDQEPFALVFHMEKLLEKLDSPTRSAIAYLESDFSKAEPFLVQTEDILKTLEALVDTAAPKDRERP